MSDKPETIKIVNAGYIPSIEMKYRKVITFFDGDTVCANVVNECNESVIRTVFISGFTPFLLKWNVIKAHKWADKMIKIAELNDELHEKSNGSE